VPILDHGFVDTVRAGRIKVVAEVESLDADSVRLVDGSHLHSDAVLCATGYRTGLEPLVGHLGVLDERGLPLVHGADTLPDLPGLYFVGIGIELSGLLREIGREARAVGQAVAQAQVAGRAGSRRS
jgi:putative flavoprotein involved in K+ transport